MLDPRKEMQVENEKKKEIEKAVTINTLNGIFTERLESKDKEVIGQKDGNKQLNQDGDREEAEKFQRVIREKQGGDKVKLIDI